MLVVSMRNSSTGHDDGNFAHYSHFKYRIPSCAVPKFTKGLQVNFEDLRMVDTIICQFLTAIRTCEDDGVTSDEEFRGEKSLPLLGRLGC